MKDDKKIIKEVKRLQEIMGINKPLLLEQGKLLADLLSTLARKEVTKFSKEMVTAIGALTDATTTEARKAAADKVVQLARKESPNGLYKKIMNAASKDVDINKVLDDLFSDEEINAFRLSVQKLLRNGETDGQILNTYRTMIRRSDLSEIERAGLEKRIRDQISSLRKTTDGIPDIKIKKTNDDVRITKDGDEVADAADDAADEVADDVADDVADGTSKLSDEEVEKTVKDFEETPWGSVEKIDEVTAKYIMDSYQGGAFGRWIRADFRSATDVLEKRAKNLLELSKYYTEGASTALKAQIEDQIKKELYDLAVNGKKVFKETNSKLIDVINGFEKDARGNLINANQKRFVDYIGKISKESEGFENVEKMLELTSGGRSKISVFKDALSGSFKSKNVTNSTVRLFSKLFGKATNKTTEKVGKGKAALRWLATGSPRGVPWLKIHQKNYLEIIESGGLSAAKQSYALELVFRLIQWKVCFSLLYTLKNYLAYVSIGSDKRKMIDKCLSSAPKDKIKNCKGVDNFLEVWALDFMEGSKESQIRWLKEFMDQLYGVNSWDNITDMIPGKADDLVNFVWRFLTTSAKDEFIDNLEQSMSDGMDEAKEGISNTTEEIEDTIENGGSPTPSGGEPGSLEHFIEDTGAVGATIVNGVIMFDGYGYKWDDTEKEYVDVK